MLRLFMSGVEAMIEIQCKEFNGDRDALARFLRERLKAEVRADRNVFRIGSIDRPGTQLSAQEVKDMVKRALHHMRLDEYHIIVQEGVLSIRQRKGREHHERKKGSAPSVRQTVPYFFPG
jgi:hypothetical protein